MADRLARLFGTEEDKVNCSFFFKIGACRHADKCTRTHYRPPISQTLLIPHMYDNPPAALAMAEGREIPREAQKEVQKQFEEFYEDIFLEMSNFGEIEEIVVCDNIGDHLIGNVYVKFVYDDDAKSCKDGLTGRYYGGSRLTIHIICTLNLHIIITSKQMSGSQSFQSLVQYLILKKLVVGSLTTENATAAAIAILCMPSTFLGPSKRSCLIKCLKSTQILKKRKARVRVIDAGIGKADQEAGIKIQIIREGKDPTKDKTTMIIRECLLQKEEP
eukprot:TRINITY_DN544_c0_g2_i4.p1 TRINITY_DN544_c0_g2~~TRINITY_DN544_c0_g2_i4.p1  ORF type:complete len:274 (-),score=24.16 TRINITY_DN544_c0_g2_i4:109-930(-)